MKRGNCNEIRDPWSFYKLIVNPTIQFKKLRLPESFAKQFGHKLSETCYLEVQTGEIHPVVLVEEGGELWFKHGWKEFMKRYSVGCGYFMHFEYKGHSKFNASIFDLTACEISYPGEFGDVSPEFPEELNGDNDDDREYFGPENEKFFDEEATEMSNEDDEIMSEESESISVSGTGVPEWLMKLYYDELKCIAAAGIPTPKNPFFVALIRSFAFNRKGYLNIPRAFSRQDFKCEAGIPVKLEMSDGKYWVVRCSRRSGYCNFGKGWVKFVKQSGIKLGDVCLFELTDAKNWVFKVQVARAS